MNHALDIIELVMIFFLYLLFFLPKSFLNAYIKEKGANLATKEDIGEITNTVETIKLSNQKELAELSATLKERQHVFAITTTKEFEILDRVWSALLEYRDSLLHLRSACGEVPSNEQSISNSFSAALAHEKAARAAIARYRPFYPEELYAAFHKTIKIIEATQYNVFAHHDDPYTFTPSTEIIEHLNSYFGQIDECISTVCTAIRHRFAA